MRLKQFHQRWERKRDAQICSLLEEDSTVAAVDLGSGTGELSRRMQATLGCESLIGADIWDEGLSDARSRGIDVVKTDLDDEFPFESRSFDVVVTNQVIEHLWFPTTFLEEIYRVLKPDGYSIISTENLSSWDNVVALVLGFSPFSMQTDVHRSLGNPVAPFDGEKLEGYPPHTRILTYAGLKALLEEVGFSIEDAKGSGYVPFNRLSDVDVRHSRFITVKVRKRGRSEQRGR